MSELAHYRVEVEVLTRTALLLVLALVPAAAHAQDKAWDIAGTVGLFAGYTPASDVLGYQEEWAEAAQGGVTLGRYLTRHVKLEFEASTTTGGSLFRERQIVVPGYPYPYPVGSEVSTSVSSLGTAVTWQFRDNDWVHPFVQAGVAAEFDHVTTRTWRQEFFGSPGRGTPVERLVISEDSVMKETRRHARALLGGGAKVYFSEHGFVRTDARWTFDPDRHNLSFRIGVGLDF